MKTQSENHKEKHELKNHNEEMCCDSYINIGFQKIHKMDKIDFGKFTKLFFKRITIKHSDCFCYFSIQKQN